MPISDGEMHSTICVEWHPGHLGRCLM